MIAAGTHLPPEETLCPGQPTSTEQDREMGTRMGVDPHRLHALLRVPKNEWKRHAAFRIAARGATLKSFTGPEPGRAIGGRRDAG